MDAAIRVLPPYILAGWTSLVERNAASTATSHPSLFDRRLESLFGIDASPQPFLFFFLGGSHGFLSV